MEEIIRITEDTLEWDDDIKSDKQHFDTDKEIEVRIPFEGYYSIAFKCDDPQIAMFETLIADKLVGLTSLEGVRTEILEIQYDNTYAIIKSD